jgi:hypothetical protein
MDANEFGRSVKAGYNEKFENEIVILIKAMNAGDKFKGQE